MHKDLAKAFNQMLAALKKDLRCLGGWHFGSVGRHEDDIYSDYDPIFLIKDKDFDLFDADIPDLIRSICDDLLIFWPEDFNDHSIRNYCCTIRLGSNLHQLDFFIINQSSPDNWMTRLHCTNCTSENIIFDHNGEVLTFLNTIEPLPPTVYNPVHLMDTYWFHVEMLIKYFKRNDIFKLKKVIDTLFHTHVNLLLAHYNTLSWGSWESQIAHCVPAQKQSHLHHYMISPDIASIEQSIKTAMSLFLNDSQEYCQSNHLTYMQNVPDQIITYFSERLSDDSW